MSKLLYQLHRGLLLAIVVLFISVGVGIVVNQKSLSRDHSTLQHVNAQNRALCIRVNKAHAEFQSLINAQINSQKKALKSNEASNIPNLHKRTKQNREAIKRLNKILDDFQTGPC